MIYKNYEFQKEVDQSLQNSKEARMPSSGTASNRQLTMGSDTNASKVYKPL